MAEVNIPQDRFMCSVCLDLLKDPVTIPCGHSYCMSCITNCWNQEDQKRIYSCPQCRQTFTSRPALNKNVMITEMVEELKKTRLQNADQCYAGPEDVKCDVCTERKYKAVKSCLECLNSYCQNHLQQHEQFFHVNKHNLMDPTRRLNEMICSKHRKHLEIYCRTDQKCICYPCTMDEHKDHDTVAAVTERTEKQRVLGETQRNLKQRIQEREKKLQELRETLNSYKRSAQTAVEYSERIFTELIRSIERRRSEVTQLIRDQEKTAVSRAEGVLEQLEQEIEDLRRRDTELEQLLHTDNHIHFLKSFQCLSAPPESTVSHITVSSLVSFDDVRKSVYQLKEKMEDFCRDEREKISGGVSYITIVPDEPMREEFLQFLGEKKRNFKQRIQEREKKHQELRETVNSYKRSAQTAVEDSERIFTELIRSIERRRSEVTQLIRDQKKTAVSQAEGVLKCLEQEIEDLRRRETELEQLLHTDNHIHFLKSFQCLSAPPESTVSHISVSSLVSFDDVRKSVCQLKEKLEDFCREEMEKISGGVSYITIVPDEPKMMEEFLQYFRLFTLDLNTVNKYIRLSNENTTATYIGKVQLYPDHPDRFDDYLQVLCRESVFGRCYWEVEWSGDVGISVSYKSISRRGQNNECLFGFNDQSWSLFCSDSTCSFWHNNKHTDLPVVSRFCRIGVYVDHRAGILSFYSVSDTMTLIHRVQTTFTHPLYPGFYARKGSYVKMFKFLCHMEIYSIWFVTESFGRDTEKLEAENPGERKEDSGAQKDCELLQERIFTELIRSIERRRSVVTQLIRDQEKTAVSQAEGVLKCLEQEIKDLRRRDTELKQLLHTDNHIHFLKSFQCLSAPPESTVSHISVSSLVSFDDVSKSVCQLKEKLEYFCRDEIEKIPDGVSYITIVPDEPMREEFLQYFRQFTLDLNTVNKYIRLSDGNTTATNTGKVALYPDHPDRFDGYLQVLCRESVFGRCYWEVEWSGDVSISVSYKSISRSGQNNECLFGRNDHSWRLLCSDSTCSFWHKNKRTYFPVVSSSCRIGVYVDHRAGILSFYSVSDTITLIHRVKTTFTHPLYPGFAVCDKSTVKLCRLTKS
ncbi:uncharacterized protein LOC130412861 [Triplophysa dalaica]|uniref:uncharacterized protein LOC130412861 n=1 Tax=Triplophysa dalaica TaxID=1582913 RepID=UPI0024E00189|nr:uncharacterized protein LOC130412861 [Triplophysa dalaica]